MRSASAAARPWDRALPRARAQAPAPARGPVSAGAAVGPQAAVRPGVLDRDTPPAQRTQGQASSRFTSRHRVRLNASHPRIAQEMRKLLRSSEEPPWLDRDAKLLLRAARSIADQAGLHERTVLPKDYGFQWFPWVGSRCKRTLVAFAERSKVRLADDSLSITYRCDSASDLKDHLSDITHATIDAAELARFVSVRAVEKFDSFLGDALDHYAVGKEQLDVAAAMEAAANALAETSLFG